MAAWQPEEMNSLYCHVMAHAEKFADVTCDGGAEAFNRELLQDAANNDEEVVETPISIEVIDAVAKKEPGFVAGFGDKVHVEFVVALKRGSQLKTVGKRYSELEEFHAVLLSHNLVDRLQAPPFPEKQTFRDSWYKFDATDVNSDFVRNRRVALDQYLRNLFGTFPTLFHEPIDFQDYSHTCKTMAKTPSQKSDNAPQKRSREVEEPRQTSRLKSLEEGAKAKAAAEAKKKELTEYVDSLEPGREGDAPPASEGTEALQKRVASLRLMCDVPCQILPHPSGVYLLPHGVASAELGVSSLRRLVNRVAHKLVTSNDCGLAGVAAAGGVAAFIKRYDDSSRAYVKICGGGDVCDWRASSRLISPNPTSMAARAIDELAREGYDIAQIFLGQMDRLQTEIEAAAGRGPAKSNRVALLEYGPGGKTRWHGDAAQGDVRSVLTWSEDDVAKYLLLALAKDDREKPYEKPGHLGVYEHYHLGNLVLRPGDAYVTDTTAAGMRALGRGEDCNYAIVHKVPPTACSQFALIVDWFF